MGETQAQQILKLKESVSRAQRFRAQAEGTLDAAKRALEEVEGKLRALGVDPANADVQVRAMQDALALKIAEWEAQVDAEIREYESVLQDAKGAL